MSSLRATIAGTAAILSLAAGCAFGGSNSEKTGHGGIPGFGGSAGSGACPSCDPGTESDSGSSAPDAGTTPEAGPSTDAGGSPEAGPVPDSGADTGSVPSSCPPGPIDLSGVTLYSNPPDLASWPVTTTLTEVDFTSDGVHVEFSKIDGTDRWPDVVPPGWSGPLQYTIGMVECIGGAWYASAVIEVWYGLYAAGGNVADSDQVAVNWYYDSVRWGQLAGRQPATGETIGIFVAAGNLRNITTDDTAQSPVMERSNVVLVPMPDVTGATHSF
jgi:hypothetical protein